MQVNIVEARKQLSRLIRAALAGEEVIIANRGEPVVRIVPARAADEPSPPGDAAALLAWLADHPPPVRLRRTREQIDADIEAERNAWD
ncbi:MAG TPA: type II toxin-antitoxin system prevent-host-death family antitoxin [Quisquiliibacterium sp.]|nr:type II toxin-antitoxin system prevent-host-death family antitoxin [Quisquiliibacterium sp.]